MAEITSPRILLLEDLKLYVRGPSRDFEGAEGGFYLERLNSGSEVRAMRNKSRHRMGRAGSEAQVGEAKLGKILRTYTSAVTSSQAQLKPEGCL